MHQIHSDEPNRRIKPGHLLEPFGWAADRLTTITIADPNLINDLLAIDCSRMHLIALVLAHLRSERFPDLGKWLICDSVRAIAERIPALDPRSLERVLGLSFPSSVLKPENYRRLVTLLADTNASSFLQNADYVSDTIISTLHGLPPPLRTSCVIEALDPIELEYGFSDGLHFLVSRGAAPSFDDLVCELATINEKAQLILRIGELVETLPLPTEFPPLKIQNARRIDCPAEVRFLSANLKGLDVFIGEINAGICALYLWEDDDFSAFCSVTRCERFGWFLNHVKGPDNAGLDPEQCAQIHSVFSQAGFPHLHTVLAVALMSREAELLACR